MTQIILNGIALADLLNEFRAIVKDEVSTITTSPQPTTGKRYLNAKEAAALLGIKLQTLYQNIDKLPKIRKHGKLHFVESELIAYMEGGQKQ